MSDALCGPSNALQNFKNHASVDRTLQQDRLTARQSPVQGFRSQNPREGILDPEFAAFEANLAGPAVPELQHPAHFGPPAAQIPAPHHPGNADWASDFQNLQISGPAHHAPQLQHMSSSPAIAGGWQNEFMNQQQHQRPAHAQQAPGMNRAFQPAFAPSYPMQSTSMMQHQQQPQEHHAPAEKFDESAFEAAFEQARADMDMELQTNATETVQESIHETVEENAEPVVHEEIRIGSDTIPQADKGRGADELARTAGELLDRVQHDQSQKFQQSNFLALMRRIRDREVQVEGDDFRETAQSLHPGGQYYPGNADIITDTTRTRAPAEEASPDDRDLGPGDTNALYEGWIHTQGLKDRRTLQPTVCFVRHGLAAHTFSDY